MSMFKQISVAAVSLLVFSGVSASLSAQSGSANTLAEPVTASQLKTLLTENKALQNEKAETRAILRAHYEQLPNWFPGSLWSQIDSKVEAANLLKVDLPIYQKYLSRQQADQLIAFFQSPSGSAVAAHTSSLTSDSVLASLVAARLNELDPQQRAADGAAFTTFRDAQPKIASERKAVLEAAYNAALKEVVSQNQAQYAFASASPSASHGSPTTPGDRAH